MKHTASSHYTFGDSNLAAARLEHLAAAYGPSSEAFLERSLPGHVHRAVDLGSGLGITTAMLQRLTHAEHVVGYERSTQYLESARLRYPDIVFRDIDVQCPPYPERNIDVIYSRFLLTHLTAPQKVIGACISQLARGGRLLLEETADLTSALPTLQRYYELVGEMQSHYGQELYLGRRLEELASSVAATRVTAQLTPILISAVTMARLHAMNIATWKQDPFMRDTHGTGALDALEQALLGIANGADSNAPVTCVMAQVVIERDS